MNSELNSLKNYLSPAAYQSLLKEKASRLKAVAERGSGLQRILEERANKVYGSWHAYEQAVSVLAVDQRKNYERAGIILQPKQVAMAKAARLADVSGMPDEIGIGGSRGGGKSFNVFSQVAVDDCVRFPGLKVLYLRRTAKAGQEQMQDLVQSTLRHVDCEPKATRIDYANGSRIVIGGYKDDKEAMKYQGIEYDTLVIEELTQLSEHTYKTLRLSARSSKGWRPRNYNTFNPLGIGHMWVKKRFIEPYRKGEASRTVFIPSTVDDNVFNNPEYVENLEDLSGAELKAYRYGDWDVASGAYFENWHHESHVIPTLASVPYHWRVVGAMDAGFSHWNMTYLIAEDDDGNKYVFHELAHRKHHPSDIAPEIHAALAGYGLHIGHVSPFVVGTDAFRMVAGQQQTVAEQYSTYNIMLTPADMSPGSRIAGWQLIARLMGDPRNGKRPQLFITQNCRRLIEALPYAERDPRNPEDVRKWDTDDNGNGGDDPLDGVRYGLQALASGGTFGGAMAMAQYNTFIEAV